jgi:hypothetical protein
MAKMTPEQEAAYALDFGTDKSGLPPRLRPHHPKPVYVPRRKPCK